MPIHAHVYAFAFVPSHRAGNFRRKLWDLTAMRQWWRHFRHSSKEHEMDLTPVEPTATDAWIDTHGRFYAVGECGHSRFAEAWLARENQPDSIRWIGVTHLERQGWLHLSGGFIYRNGGRTVPTAAQTDTLFATLAAYRNAGSYRTATLEQEFRAIMNGED